MDDYERLSSAAYLQTNAVASIVESQSVFGHIQDDYERLSSDRVPAPIMNPSRTQLHTTVDADRRALEQCASSLAEPRVWE